MSVMFIGNAGITLTQGEYDRLLGVYRLENSGSWAGDPAARPTFEQWIRSRNEGVKIITTHPFEGVK